MKFIFFLIGLGLLFSCKANEQVKIIKQSDMPETKKIASIEGKKLNEYATLEIQPEVFFTANAKIRSAILADNGRLYFGNEDCEFYAVDIASKQALWVYTADQAVQTWPVIADGKIIFNAGDSLYILDCATGKELHKVTCPSQTPAISKKLTRVSDHRYSYNDSYAAVSSGIAYYAILDGSLAAVDINNGEVIWTFPSVYKGWVASGVNFYNGKLYYTDITGALCCVDTKTRRMVFRTEIDDNIHAPLHINDGKIYAAGRSCKVHCIDANTGDVIWLSFPHNTTSWFSGGSVSIGSTLYSCTSDEYTILAFNKDNGDFLRTYSTTVNAYTQPVLNGENIIVAATDVYSRNRSHIMEFDTKNHWKLWQARITDFVVSSPAIYEGAVYFGSDSGKIYSINLKNIAKK